MKKKNSGFSLIELVIVIAIMAVLVALIVPNLTKYLGKSKTNSDDKNIDEIKACFERAVAQISTDIGDPIVTGNWIKFEPTCVYYDTSIPALNSNALTFAEHMKKEIPEIPKSKITKDYYYVYIESHSDGSYEVKVKLNHS